ALVDEGAIEVVVNIHNMPSPFARQRDRRSVETNPLAQIARQHALRRQLHRRDIGIDRLELVGERSCEQLDCGRRWRHHGGRRQILCPAAVGSAIDDRAVAEPVGGDDDRPRNLELLLQRRGHAASRALTASTGAARQGAERAATSPMTRMAGPSPPPAAQAANRSRPPTAPPPSPPPPPPHTPPPPPPAPPP